jgi:hypothetical protein
MHPQTLEIKRVIAEKLIKWHFRCDAAQCNELGMIYQRLAYVFVAAQLKLKLKIQ